jgi:hypothetical protein
MALIGGFRLFGEALVLLYAGCCSGIFLFCGSGGGAKLMFCGRER